MGGWSLRMTWGLDACYTIFHIKPESALRSPSYGYSGGTQRWVGVWERVIWAVEYIQHSKWSWQAVVWSAGEIMTLA